jgi:uncharacterized protein (DUF111 family)
MTTTLTIRIPSAQRAALRARARAVKVTESELARQAIEEKLQAGGPSQALDEFCGCMDLSRKDTDPWRKKLRERNWRS